MPIYEYRCTACGHELETLRKLSDPPLVVCPECKAETLMKKLSAAGFQLKGSGWYATDFRDKGKAPAPKKDAAPAAADQPAADGKSDAAAAPSAAKAESTPAAPAPAASTPAPASTPTPGSSS